MYLQMFDVEIGIKVVEGKRVESKHRLSGNGRQDSGSREKRLMINDLGFKFLYAHT